MNRFKQDYYNDISKIEKSLKRIADALENSNVTQDELYTDDIKAQDDALNKETANEHETNCDYLHHLVQDLGSTDYNEFCNTHCLPSNDAVTVSNYITDLDYAEVLGVISDLEKILDKELIETDLQGIIVDSDHDIRSAAQYYTEILNNTSHTYEGDNLKTKKDCILDYVTNEFGITGARYTDIIKFAYYLGAHNAPKYSNSNRGYYATAFNVRLNGHLIQGGKDCLVKGINKEGKERYFALSSVDSFTDYYRGIA